jgi:hypothetical protein
MGFRHSGAARSAEPGIYLTFCFVSKSKNGFRIAAARRPE